MSAGRQASCGASVCSVDYTHGPHAHADGVVTMTNPDCDHHVLIRPDEQCPGLDAHCAVGEHCTFFTASCAAEQTGDDHPSTCCVCKRPLDSDDLIPVDIRVKPIADELDEVRARLKADKAREAELTMQVRALVPEDGTYGPVNVSTPRTLDKDALAAAYPVETHPYLYGLAIDPAKAKAHLSEDVLDRFKVDGTPRVGLVK